MAIAAKWHNSSQSVPRLTAQTFAIIGLFLTLRLTTAAWRNYRAWLALGPGGFPYNIFGWLAQWLVYPFAHKKLLSRKEYCNPVTLTLYGPRGATKFLEGYFPKRSGGRPYVPMFVAPQRQAPGSGNDDEIQQLQRTLLTALRDNNPGLLDLRTSGLERYGNALFLTAVDLSPPGTTRVAGEIAHFHLHNDDSGWAGQPDGSGHVTLSLADADEVVEKGWGQAHMLTGKLGVPHGYTMLYAPRDSKELEIVERIVKAAVRYMSGGQEIK